MGKLKPLVIDGEYTTIDDSSPSKIADIFPKTGNLPVTVTAFNSNTGVAEVITREEAKSKPLSEYSDIQTHHTEAIRG